MTLKRDAAALRMVPKAKVAVSKTLNPADQLAEFYRFFPNEDTAADWMRKLYAAAALQGVDLEQGDYQLVHDPDGKITRYDIVLPVRGGYLQIRKFIAQALMDVPALSLDSITFSRQKIGDAAIDAQLRFTLYLVRQ
jgi:hypothetical protein